jgi:hypothetical protein
MLVTLSITALLVLVSVMVHYEALKRISDWLPKSPIGLRFRVAVGLFGALSVHLFEVTLFSIGYYFATGSAKYGRLQGSTDSFADCVYYSFVAYTSLGFGDIVPTGALRFLTAMETLTGLVLIAWTASFMFFQMHRFWEDES